jgi:hypothetical protein
VEPSALAIQSVNTIVNDAGVLSASNTDYIAVQRLIAEHQPDPAASVLINGSGGMAKAVDQPSATTDFRMASSSRAIRSPDRNCRTARLSLASARRRCRGVDPGERHAGRNGRGVEEFSIRSAPRLWPGPTRCSM